MTAGNQAFSYSTPITGVSIITRSGGAVVTGTLQVSTAAAKGYGATDPCVVAGTLVGHPPLGIAVAIFP